MSRLEIILSCTLVLSMGFNILIFAYARTAITKLLTVSEELGDLQQMINRFSLHVKDVYNLEMFYGDETLKHLMDHATALDNQLQENFHYIYSLTEEPEEETEEDEVIMEEMSLDQTETHQSP
jgi:hypothetical protein|tara:strand:+ start:2549 stop:2917 length:369 start_codon:yes stop_codon:yes gene_type:complete